MSNAEHIDLVAEFDRIVAGDCITDDVPRHQEVITAIRSTLCRADLVSSAAVPTLTEPQGADADILDDGRVDKELRRWQDAIRDKLIDLGAPDRMIDGAGCDSGDPLDFTLAEIGQGVGYFIDQLESGYWPVLRDRGDGVKGHFCIGRLISLNEPYWEYWNAGQWASAGEVFVGRELAQAKLDELRSADARKPVSEDGAVVVARGDDEQKWRVALRMFEKSQAALYALRQQVEDTIIVAQTDTDEEDTITAYHFKTGAIHRLLAKAREGDGPADDSDSAALRSAITEKQVGAVNAAATEIANRYFGDYPEKAEPKLAAIISKHYSAASAMKKDSHCGPNSVESDTEVIE